MSREHLGKPFGAALGPIDAMEHSIEDDDERFGSTSFETRPSLANTHANLVRMSTARELFMKALASKHVELRREDNGQWRFFIQPGVEADIIPWWMGKNTEEKLWLWGLAGKMDCPTWDLPAGAPSIGGSCPGAVPGQSVVPAKVRDAAAANAHSPPGLEVPFKANLNESAPDDVESNGGTICQYCYAMGGQYWNQGVQPKEVLTLWWSERAIRNGTFAPIVAESLLNDPRLKVHDIHGVKHRPVRLHSSGDFFSQEYAKAWVDACNLVGDMEAKLGLTPSLFWAPTRTWVTWHPSVWNNILSKLKRDNLRVRASAYNLDDEAPDWLVPGGTDVMGNARGSTSVWAAHQKKKDARFDYNCPVYELDAETSKTCTNAKCRACWIHPEKRINYTTHF